MLNSFKSNSEIDGTNYIVKLINYMVSQKLCK